MVVLYHCILLFATKLNAVQTQNAPQVPFMVIPIHAL